MKHTLLLLFTTICLISCKKQEVKETALLDYIPNNPTAIINAPSIKTLQKELQENVLIEKFNTTNTYKNIQKDFQFCNEIKSSNSILISYAKVGKSLEYLFSIKTKGTENTIPTNTETKNYNNTSYQELKNQKAYSIVLDSTLVVSSSEILIENLIRNNKDNIRYNNKSLLKLHKTADGSKVTAFININKQPDFLRSILPTQFSGTTDWISVELNNANGIITNGIATNTNVTHDFAKNLLKSATEKSNTSAIIPSNFTQYTSYNFNTIELNSTFENFNELLDNTTEVVSFKDGKNSLCAFKLLNSEVSENLTTHNTYRNTVIYKNSYFKIPATICKPQPAFACYLDDFILLSNSVESLQNCISHYQNKTTLNRQSYYTEHSDALLSEAHIIKSTKTVNLKNKLAAALDDESINAVKLTEFPLTMHQVTYEDNYIQFNSVLKKVSPKSNTASVTQIASVTLDADLASDLQWVTNHKTSQKELIIQDTNNQLYLISNKGVVLWKKQLDSKIQGKVIQVDLFKNKKLQFAFTTENEFMVLDRNGKLVDPFHKKFNNGSLLPLAVFDYDSNRNYRFMITQDNKTLLYDNKFKLIKGFKFNETESTILEAPKHIRIGAKDYIVINENNGKLHILNRQGKDRTKVKSIFAFSKNNELQQHKNSLLFKDSKNAITEVNIATGSVSKTDLLQGNNNHYTVKDNLIVKLEDQNLSIKKNTLELDFGNYTRPEVFYLNKKYYISVTDIDTQKVYLYNSKATLLDMFPVYGQSTIALTNMDNDTKLEFAVKGETNSILIYKMY